MKKLAMALATILIMNLAAPAASVYAAPDETVTETVAEDLTESTEEADTVEEGESILPDSSEENTETFVEEVLLSETTEAETESSGEESESVMETEEIIEETVVEEIVMEEQTQEETPVLTEWVGVDTTSGNNLVTETPESDFEWDGETIIIKYIGTAETVVIPQRAQKISANAFKGNTTITSVTITSNINSIGDNAFYNCSGLKSVKFETTKLGTNCGGNIFQGCSLNSVTFAEGMTTIPNHLFINAGFESGAGIVIPEGVTEIGADAFQDAVNLSSVTFAGNKVVTIKEDAFLGTGIEEIDLPESVKVIEAEAFRSCTNLREITIPQNVTTLGGSVFYNCSGLKSVKFETTKLGTRCGGNNFQGCSINSVTFAEGTTYIPGNLFICAGFESGMGIVIPEGVTEIGADAFQEAVNLSSVTFAGNKVVTIKEDAFLGTGIEEIDLPESVKVIEAQAFYNCDKLTEITIPNKVTTLGNEVFWACDSLERVILPSKIKNMGRNLFSKNSFLKIYAPKGSASYKWAKKNGYTVGEIFTITYKLNGGVNGKDNPKNYEKGDILTFNDPTKTGFDFVGWYKDSKFKKPFTYSDTTSGNLTLYARWKAIQYPITYETNGGTLAKKSPLSYKITAAVALKNPSRAGYTFTGWYTSPELASETKVTKIKKGSTGEKILYAGWKANVYKIKFAKNAKNATGTMSAITGVVYDTDVTLSSGAFARKGYTFEGWNTKANGRGTAIEDGATVKNLCTKNNGTVTLYAVWKAIPYTITYHLDGGNNSAKNPDSYTVAQTITFAKPKKTGYTFKGWYKDADLTQKISKIKAGSIGELELYAKWQVNKYTVVFNANKGKGKMVAMKNCEYNKTYQLSENLFKRNGYTFTGWNTKANGTGTAYGDLEEIENLTSVNQKKVILYAQWKKN